MLFEACTSKVQCNKMILLCFGIVGLWLQRSIGTFDQRAADPYQTWFASAQRGKSKSTTTYGSTESRWIQSHAIDQTRKSTIGRENKYAVEAHWEDLYFWGDPEQQRQNKLEAELTARCWLQMCSDFKTSLHKKLLCYMTRRNYSEERGASTWCFPFISHFHWLRLCRAFGRMAWKKPGTRGCSLARAPAPPCPWIAPWQKPFFLVGWTGFVFTVWLSLLSIVITLWYNLPCSFWNDFNPFSKKSYNIPTFVFLPLFVVFKTGCFPLSAGGSPADLPRRRSSTLRRRWRRSPRKPVGLCTMTCQLHTISVSCLQIFCAAFWD